MTLAHDEQYCSSCGSAIKQAAARCPECGVPNDGSGGAGAGQTEFCESCGEEIRVEAEVCPNCGVSHRSSGLGSGSDLDELLYYGQIILGAFLLLAALGALTDGETSLLSSLVSGLVLGVIGLALLPPVRERLEKRHPVTTFGRTQTVREVSVSNATEPCSACYEEVDSGVRREYGSEFVVAGVTLTSQTEGGNMYCQSCLAVESSLEQLDTSVAVDESDDS